MNEKTGEQSQNAILSQAIRAIRAYRRMRSTEVAHAMGMPIRTYEHFEAGTGRITYARLVAFALATDSDPVAILATVPLRSPNFALRCADNKLMTIMYAAIRELDDSLQNDIELLEARTIIGAMDKLTKGFEDHIGGRDLYAERWMAEKAAKVDGARLRPRPGRK